jgi:hypothetical protein
MTRSTTPLLQSKQSNHGHKRKGKPVEAWMLELEKAQDEENGARSLDLTTIEQIADGVERMVFSWGLDKQEKGHEYVKLSQLLAKENIHTLSPWRLNKVEEALDLASESEHMVARNDLEGMVENGGIHLELAQARTPVIGIRHASPKLTHARQRNSRRERSMSLQHEVDLENPQSLKARNGAPQGKHESSNGLLSCSCHGVLTSSNRMRMCPIQSKGRALHDFENRTREDSSCQAMALEYESMGGMIETNGAEPIATKEHTVLHCKEAKLWLGHKEESFVWTPKEASPLSPNTRRQQQCVMNQTKNQLPPPVLAPEVTMSVAPLLSQSPLCAQSSSPRVNIAHNGEVSNEHDGLFTSVTNPHESRSEDFNSLLPLLDPSPCCGEETESVEVGTSGTSLLSFLLSINFIFVNSLNSR